MKIDKEINNIAYNDEFHKYWNKQTSEIYTSVTTFIKLFEYSFDQDYFSKYKAIEKCDFELFSKFKKLYGFKNVVSNYEKTNKFSENYINAQSEILKEWKEKNTLAIEKGLKRHKQEEEKVLKEGYFIFENEKYLLKDKFEKSNKNEVFPELLVYDNVFKIAGQCDIILKDKDNNITVIDYKTNESIDTKNSFQKMKKPISHLDQCNYNTYCLQLSLYAYILERKGFTVKDLYIFHMPEENINNIIPCQYRKQELIYMLELSQIFEGICL